MDYLRWILLAAGIFFVLIIYFVGRKSGRQDTIYDNREDDAIANDDTPESIADNWASDWQDPDESVGDVRIAAREKDVYEDGLENKWENKKEPFLPNDALTDANESRTENVDTAEQQGDNESVIVLYILARAPDRLAGDKINSAAQANGLKFGDMDIFHCIDNGQSVFSMANMVEPGAFDPDTMHELETPGLTLFMQKSSSNNIDIFEGMMACAYRMSEMLGAQLCNRQRQPLTQRDSDQYRELATSFDG